MKNFLASIETTYGYLKPTCKNEGPFVSGGAHNKRYVHGLARSDVLFRHLRDQAGSFRDGVALDDRGAATYTRHPVHTVAGLKAW